MTLVAEMASCSIFNKMSKDLLPPLSGSISCQIDELSTQTSIRKTG